VRTLLPAILDGFAHEHNGKRPDLIVHVGIAPNRQWYAVETRAFRDNYRITDVDEKLGYDDGEKIWKEKGLPAVLYPLPVDPARASEAKGSEHAVTPFPPNRHFLQTWQSNAPPGTDVRISDDAGRYLCEFIFYSSLALAYEQRQPQSVVFLHIPSATDDASLELGTEAAVALIKTAVACWVDEA
jgi:pyrrolidone-carboxylate peptidase